VAEAEAARIGGRRAEGSGLTPTEQRVANLVCDGLANKQIAATLMVTVGSVEAHLTRIYAKLGVRSRTDLVRALRN
jgi:DNA-binding CsgD family transcriptional regulator